MSIKKIFVVLLINSIILFQTPIGAFSAGITDSIAVVKNESLYAIDDIPENVSTTPHTVKISGAPGTTVRVSGKNIYYNSKLPTAGQTMEKNGLTFTGNIDGTVTINGTVTESMNIYDTGNPQKLGIGSYTSFRSNDNGSYTIGYNLGWTVTGSAPYLVIESGAIRVPDVNSFTQVKTASLYFRVDTAFNNYILYPYAQVGDNPYCGIEYEQYKGTQEYIIGDEGYVEIDCVAPNMTVIADNEVTVAYKAETKTSYPLGDKKIMFFGDSITAGYYRYREQLLRMSKMEQVEAFAVSGATWRHYSNDVLDGNPVYEANNTVPNQVQKLLNNAQNYESPDIIMMELFREDCK